MHDEYVRACVYGETRTDSFPLSSFNPHPYHHSSLNQADGGGAGCGRGGERGGGLDTGGAQRAPGPARVSLRSVAGGGRGARGGGGGRHGHGLTWKKWLIDELEKESKARLVDCAYEKPYHCFPCPRSRDLSTSVPYLSARNVGASNGLHSNRACDDDTATHGVSRCTHTHRPIAAAHRCASNLWSDRVSSTLIQSQAPPAGPWRRRFRSRPVRSSRRSLTSTRLRHDNGAAAVTPSTSSSSSPTPAGASYKRDPRCVLLRIRID